MNTETNNTTKTEDETIMKTLEKVNCRYFEKTPAGYNEAWYTNDKLTVYKELAEELINKKLSACTYIKSIKRRQLYNGYIEITVTYDHGGRRVYTVHNC